MFFYIYKPDSVIDSHLSRNIVANILMRHPQHFELMLKVLGTTLHLGKDLAVSPPMFP